MASSNLSLMGKSVKQNTAARRRSACFA